MTLGGAPLVIIRFNPDKYKPKTGREQTKIDKRHAVLAGLLKDIRNIKTMEHPLTCYYLFYNGWDGKVVKSPIEYSLDNKKINIRHAHPNGTTEYVIDM